MRFVNKLLRLSLCNFREKGKDGMQQFRDVLQVEVHLNLQFRDSTDVAG